MFAGSLTRLILCLIVLTSALGCSLGKNDGWKFTKSWDPRRAIGLKKDKLAPPQMPTRLVSTWTDTVLHKQGEKPKRGFGGRLLFFNEAGEDPIRVEGQLVVYAYDDTRRAAHETQPTRRFVFPADQFVRHESESPVGHSYSVWLPWDQLGGEQKNISLIARFEPKAGPLIVGEQTRHLLPGLRQLADGETAPAVKPVGEIQLTEYSEASKLETPQKTKTPGQKLRPQITSIPLSGKRWEQRLKAAQGSSSDTTDPSSAQTIPGVSQP